MLTGRDVKNNLVHGATSFICKKVFGSDMVTLSVAGERHRNELYL